MIEEQSLQLQNELHIALVDAARDAKSIGYNPTKFNQMIAAEGGYTVAKKLIHKTSSGFERLWELNRLDLSTEAVILYKKFQPLFTKKELDTAKTRLNEFGYEVEDEKSVFPPLQPSGRDSEFNKYEDYLKAKAIFEHLVNGLTHRELDESVLNLDMEKSRGFVSMSILHYLGMKADYRGIFKGKELYEVVGVLSKEGNSFEETVRLLQLLDDSELMKNIESDLKAEEVEEGHGVEGKVKYYYGKRYERDSKNRRLAIEKYGLNCFVCSFNFENTYGERGKDFIEVHHINPLSTLGEPVKINPNTDLVPLCANCHRMVHRRADDVLSIESLKKLMLSNSKQLKGE